MTTLEIVLVGALAVVAIVFLYMLLSSLSKGIWKK